MVPSSGSRLGDRDSQCDPSLCQRYLDQPHRAIVSLRAAEEGWRVMRVEDAADSIYEGLRAMDWRRYLCAMWIVCGELRTVYDDRWSAAERSLMTSTLQVVREAVMAGRVPDEVSGQAADLSERWQVFTSEHEDEVMPGQWNAWMVFRDLAAEVAGSSWRYEAAERVDLAATDRWRESFTRPGPIRDDPDEEADDASPMARMLSLLQRVVKGVAGVPEELMRREGWDPVNLQNRLLGSE